MSGLDDKVDYWEHRNLQEEVWELQSQVRELREEFDKLKKILTGDGK